MSSAAFENVNYFDCSGCFDAQVVRHFLFADSFHTSKVEKAITSTTSWSKEHIKLEIATTLQPVDFSNHPNKLILRTFTKAKEKLMNSSEGRNEMSNFAPNYMDSSPYVFDYDGANLDWSRKPV